MTAAQRKLPERDSYRAAGSAAREAIARFHRAAAADPRAFTLGTCRVFLAVLEMTVTYSRVEDRASHGELARRCHLSRKTVGRALTVLAEAGVTRYVPGTGAAFSVIGLLMEGGQHVVYPPVVEDGDETDPLSPPGVDSMVTTPPGQHVVHTTEKDPEKDLREGPEGKPTVPLPPPDRKPRSDGNGNPGFEDEPLARLDPAAELAKLRRSLWPDDDAELRAEVEAMKAEGVLIERDEQ